jgi:hypothetical protein
MLCEKKLNFPEISPTVLKKMLKVYENNMTISMNEVYRKLPRKLADVVKTSLSINLSKRSIMGSKRTNLEIKKS